MIIVNNLRVTVGGKVCDSLRDMKHSLFQRSATNERLQAERRS